MKARVLIVEDDRALLDLLCDELETEGFAVDPVGCLADARERLRDTDPDLVVTDLKLPDGSGHDVLELLEDRPERPGCLVITAFGSVRDAVHALQRGADDFLTKPLDMDHFILTIRRLREHRQMRRDLERMRGLIGGEGFHGIMGHSRAMQKLFDHVRLVARADGPVLIVGESGTGKELIARAIHRESSRSEAPFVAINCAGIPSELIESELFGYEAGAFTGAGSRRRGIFQQADGGTLLLDEIGEMPPDLQAKLLRILEDGKLRPVGSEREQSVDVRVLAATHRDVRALVSEGRFREDLYYRLETFMLEIPPLREREDDLELLAVHFLRHHAAGLGRPLEGIDPTALKSLRAYDFPGNVRELSNVMERAATFSRGPRVVEADLPARLLRRLDDDEGGDDDGGDEEEAKEGAVGGWAALTSGLPTMEALQRRYARQVLERTGGNKQRAAAILGVTRGTLYRWLSKDEP